ncbi:MAG: outer membrane lipoprotein-sorting protein [Opitutaceae bacterium]|jgi:hypothetical protein|nr:outer membrane lipoprotein-sorting protein [Opitutaceae bacterium]
MIPTHFIRQAARIACLVFFPGAALLLPPVPLAAQSKHYRPHPDYVQLTPPDQARGREILEDFRQRGIEKDYYLEFDLRVMPRRGAEKRIPGRAWGGRNADGPVTRIELLPSPDGAARTARRLLVQNGPVSAIWSWQGEAVGGGGGRDSGGGGENGGGGTGSVGGGSGGAGAGGEGGDSGGGGSSSGGGTTGVAARLDAAAMFAPLGGTELTPFDLQMPFFFWDDFVYEGVTRQGDRPMQTFLMYPPESVVAQHPAVTGVRMFVDSAYHAMMRFQVIGVEGRILKTMQLGSFKKVDGQWLMKEIDFRNEATRDKTRFDLTAAAAGLDLPPGIFRPETLSRPAEAPVRGRVTRM